MSAHVRVFVCVFVFVCVCTGLFGVSNTMAAALWVIDLAFGLMQSGAVGFNLHTAGCSPYSPVLFPGVRDTHTQTRTRMHTNTHTHTHTGTHHTHTHTHLRMRVSVLVW